MNALAVAIDHVGGDFVLFVELSLKRRFSEVIESPSLLLRRCIIAASPLAEMTLALVLLLFGASAYRVAPIAQAAGFEIPTLTALQAVMPVSVWFGALLVAGVFHMAALLAWNRIMRTVGSAMMVVLYFLLAYSIILHPSITTPLAQGVFGPLLLCAILALAVAYAD